MTIPFVWNSDPDDYTLTINSVKLVPVSKVNTKNLYGGLVSRICEKPIAQKKFDEMFPDLERALDAYTFLITLKKSLPKSFYPLKHQTISKFPVTNLSRVHTKP